MLQEKFQVSLATPVSDQEGSPRCVRFIKALSVRNVLILLQKDHSIQRIYFSFCNGRYVYSLLRINITIV